NIQRSFFEENEKEKHKRLKNRKMRKEIKERQAIYSSPVVAPRQKYPESHRRCPYTIYRSKRKPACHTYIIYNLPMHGCCCRSPSLLAIHI
ncbi:hypothetical protein, partial [Bacteroides pyogenes]|uniref:hypothetical protein n=4 Tax=Bacteroides pyogenes TaxID=310300 RepID=UPI001BA62460